MLLLLKYDFKMFIFIPFTADIYDWKEQRRKCGGSAGVELVSVQVFFFFQSGLNCFVVFYLIFPCSSVAATELVLL